MEIIILLFTGKPTVEEKAGRKAGRGILWVGFWGFLSFFMVVPIIFLVVSVREPVAGKNSKNGAEASCVEGGKKGEGRAHSHEETNQNKRCSQRWQSRQLRPPGTFILCGHWSDHREQEESKKKSTDTRKVSSTRFGSWHLLLLVPDTTIHFQQQK
jgi:hypothetical protein